MAGQRPGMGVEVEIRGGEIDVDTSVLGIRGRRVRSGARAGVMYR